MFAVKYSRPRILLAALSLSALTLGGLFAQNQRYPGLPAPFAPPPPPADSVDAPPPPNNRPSKEQRQEAKRLINEFNDSSATYDEEQSDRVTMEQLHALERFLEMPPEQLARIRQTIERVETMSPEEKDAIRARIAAFRNLEEEKINRIRKFHQVWSNLDPLERRLVHRYIMTLPRDEAEQIRQQTASMSAQEQLAQFNELLARAEAADAAGELPSMADNIRRWRRDRRDNNDNGREQNGYMNTRQPQEEPLPGPPPSEPAE